MGGSELFFTRKKTTLCDKITPILDYTCEIPMFSLSKKIENPSSFSLQAFQIFLGSVVMATLAQMQIPLWFTPVPITLGTVGPIAVGAALGPYKGALTVLLYLLEGSLGIPVFSGGTAGISRLLGPTGGYLIGFVFASFTSGWLMRKNLVTNLARGFAAALFSSGCFFLIGLPWLSLFVGKENALQMGLYPFLIGDVIKSVLLAPYLVYCKRDSSRC